MFKLRKYKSGTGWCLWRYTEVDSTYIRRLHVLKTPWFAICLHWLLKPDPEPYNHDHPVTFLSFVLRGWYREERVVDGQITVRSHRWWNFIRATTTDAHTIIAVAPNTLTLCFMGPKTREWGFHKPQHFGVPKEAEYQPMVVSSDWLYINWIFWKDYYAAKRKGVQP